MSVEDELEMKDLLMQTLTDNGCLAKIRAQLRASVFLALEEDIKLNSKKPLMNKKIKASLDSTEGQLMFCIVKEFLEFFNLESTLAVFDAESYLGISYQYNGKSKILEDLSLKEDDTVPLLHQLVHLAQCKTKTLEVNLSMIEKNFEDIDNEMSNSQNSIKTESNLNGELSDSNSNSSIDTKGCGVTVHTKNITENLNPMCENEVNLNKTFITEPTLTLKQYGEYTHPRENSTIDIQNSIEEISITPIHHITLPMPILEKIDEVTTPILKDLKISPEKVKSPPKSDKFKSKNNLNSLSDLPPLNMNKNRSGTILPSLYTKEFIEKPNS